MSNKNKTFVHITLCGTITKQILATVLFRIQLLMLAAETFIFKLLSKLKVGI